MLLSSRLAFILTFATILSTAFPRGVEGGLLTIANITGGAQPYAGVMLDSFGNLYGTTAGGGSAGAGTVFEIAKGSNSNTTIASFNGNNGNGPFGGVTFDANGNLFGTTYAGGSSGVGTVFEIIKGSNDVTEIASFNGGVDGTGAHNPFAGVTFDANGNLWGTTQLGGSGGAGTVFEIAKGSNSITTFASFNGDNGAQPFTGVTFDPDGNLFGTTAFGGSVGQGTVFEIAKGSNDVTTLASFNGENGAQPYGDVKFDANGNLYGTTYVGGSSNLGTVFEIAKGSDTVTTLASFNGGNGQNPLGGVALDANGNLYGTTYLGGLDGGVGTLFEIAKGSNAITTLGIFNESNGRNPRSDVTFDANGNLFGTTSDGGLGGGTVFEFSPVTAVPEPSSAVLVGVGLVVCAVSTWRSRGLRRTLG